jgi:hypothetical protein
MEHGNDSYLVILGRKLFPKLLGDGSEALVGRADRWASLKIFRTWSIVKRSILPSDMLTIARRWILLPDRRTQLLVDIQGSDISRATAALLSLTYGASALSRCSRVERRPGQVLGKHRRTQEGAPAVGELGSTVHPDAPPGLDRSHLTSPELVFESSRPPGRFCRTPALKWR